LLVIVYDLSSDGVFFFPTWDLHVQIKFIKFMPFIVLKKLIIKKISNLAALAFDQ
jgi:hypothetical protein